MSKKQNPSSEKRKPRHAPLAAQQTASAKQVDTAEPAVGVVEVVNRSGNDFRASVQSRATPVAELPDVLPATHEERVRLLATLMPHRWVKGKTGKEIARRWHAGPVAELSKTMALVDRASSEAWRRINAQDAGWVREHICNELLGAMDDAKSIDEAKDRVRAVVEVAKAWAPIVGASAPQRHELAGPGGGPIQVEQAAPTGWMVMADDPSLPRMARVWAGFAVYLALSGDADGAETAAGEAMALATGGE